MTDAKPVDVGALVEWCDKQARFLASNADVSGKFVAVRDALLALQTNVAALREWKKQILIAAGAQENDDVAKWICNSDAEVARLTELADLRRISLEHYERQGTEVVKELEARKVEIARLTRERDGWKKDAQTAQANWHAACNDLDRLTQENARLAGEAAARDAKIQRLEWTIEALEKGGPPR